MLNQRKGHCNAVRDPRPIPILVVVILSVARDCTQTKVLRIPMATMLTYTFTTNQ